MEAKAVAKYVKMSPIKLKPVTDLVRGKDLNEALNILKFTPGKGSEIVEKVVKSAAANAPHRFPPLEKWQPMLSGKSRRCRCSPSERSSAAEIIRPLSMPSITLKQE